MRHFLPRRPRLDAMDDSEERGVVAHARRLPFAANLPVLSIVACRLLFGAWCLPFCLAAAVCPWPLGSVACRFPLALAPFRPRSAFRRFLRAFAIPPIAAC